MDTLDLNANSVLEVVSNLSSSKKAKRKGHFTSNSIELRKLFNHFRLLTCNTLANTIAFTFLPVPKSSL